MNETIRQTDRGQLNELYASFSEYSDFKFGTKSLVIRLITIIFTKLE